MLSQDVVKKFNYGVRVLLLISRNKEGGSGNLRKQKKLISKNEEEFSECLEQLLELKTQSQRIYCSANARDVKKAIRLFKFNQLEADFYDEDSKNSFYFDIKNRWVSCLMSPKARAETRFLIDIDERSGQVLDAVRRDVKGKADIVAEYPTKNGWHLITEPFNPNSVSFQEKGLGEIKKDGLVLLDY